jgi:transcriptional regulator with XRE-family HTH domain
MTTRFSFAAALKAVRKGHGLSQEAFSDLSSRTYVSSLERGLQSPTLKKVGDLCEVLDIHPLTLLTLAYAGGGKNATDKLLARVQGELADIETQQRKVGRGKYRAAPTST